MSEGPVHLKLKPEHDTPEARAWLEKIEVAVNVELEDRLRNLVIYGTTHPEQHPWFGA